MKGEELDFQYQVGHHDNGQIEQEITQTMSIAGAMLYLIMRTAKRGKSTL